MRSIIFICSLIVLSYSTNAQLNCKTFTGKGGDSVVCFHKNGKVSSIDFETIEHKNYYEFQAFDVSGNQVLKANHGYLHGGASLDVKYYDNGAIRSARKTFQPDGGIQHYDATSFFNEDGTFHHEEDNSWDRQILVHTPPIYDFPEKKSAVVEVKKDTVKVFLKNTTSRNLKVLVGKTTVKEAKQILKIKKHSELEIGTFVPTKTALNWEQFYAVEVLPFKKKYEIITVKKTELDTPQKQFIVFLH